MNLSDFNYELPKELIAQTPLKNRDESRLLVYNMKDKSIVDSHFYSVIDYLNEGDCLVINDSKVLPARLLGVKEDTGANVEILLLEDKGDNIWEAIVRPGKKLRKGAKVVFNEKLSCTIEDVLEDGNRYVKFIYDGNFYEILDEIGQMPLPPYIKEKLEDRDRYQTVYAKDLGSAAAPTAGLHFTNELLDKIKAKGVNILHVTLHVGLGTFRPVKVDNILDHHMHSEYYTLPKETVDAILKAKANGKKIFAVGTTSCRTLEGSFAKNNAIVADHGYTNIFIYPGFKFNVIDALITNFHLPESTLLMLVSALAGREEMLSVYKHAVDEKYRFFSFGDAMLIY